MRKTRWLLLLLVLAAPLLAATPVLDLMLDGRFGEAKQMIEKSNLSPRYELLYYAMTEAEAARACSLYQVIAIRYPQTDCDSIARERLDQARSMGFAVVPIAEWSQAPANATPLFSQKVEVAPPAEPTLPAPPQSAPPTPPVVTAPVVQPRVASSAESTKVEADTLKMVSKIPQRAAEPVKAEPKPEPVPSTAVPTVTDQSAAVSAPAEAKKPETVETPRVQPLPPSLQPHDKPVEPSAGHWFVQVGAFANFENAHKLSQSLQTAGYSVKLVPLDGKTKLLQVRVGGYMTRAELRPVMAQLKEKFKVPTAVVNE